MDGPQPEGHMASHIERRKFLATLGGAAAAWPLAARAQQAERMRRIGILMSRAADEMEGRLVAYVQALRDFGWVEGRNVQLDVRRTTAADIRKDVAELVAAAPDVILTSGGTILP